MIKKVFMILSILLFPCVNVYAKEYKSIEIFYINTSSIVKKIESSPKIEKEIESYLQNIKGIYGKFNPIPKKGYMVKIPLDTPIMVQNQWINSFIDEVIIIFPENESPYLIVFDNKERIIFFTFDGDTNVLCKYLKFNPESSMNLFNIKLIST